MKWIIIVLMVCAISGLAGGISGVRSFRMSSATGTEIVRYEPWARGCVLAFGLCSAAAAYGCAKRKMFGWVIAASLMVIAICVTVWGIGSILFASLSNISTATWWAVQTVGMVFLLRWWLAQRKSFVRDEEGA